MTFVEGAPKDRSYGFFEIFGMMVAISGDSHYRTYTVEQLTSYLLPALDARQFKLYLDDEGKPGSFITWALVNDEWHRGLHDRGENPPYDQWNSGPHLWFIDLVTPSHNAREIVRDVQKNIFPDRHAYAIRRDEAGGIRRICKWRNSLVE